MSGADDLIEQRKKLDDRKYLISSLSEEFAPRMHTAVNALRDFLLDGKWHRWSDTLAAMLTMAEDLQVKTCDNIMHKAVRAGLIERRGEWHRHRPDSRALRIVEWPDLDEETRQKLREHRQGHLARNTDRGADR